MLKNKPKRYQDIIRAKLNRHNVYLDLVDKELGFNEGDLNIVAMYMVQLDNEYVINKNS